MSDELRGRIARHACVPCLRRGGSRLREAHASSGAGRSRRQAEHCHYGLLKCLIDFHANTGTQIAITLVPLTLILSPVIGGEGRARGVVVGGRENRP